MDLSYSTDHSTMLSPADWPHWIATSADRGPKRCARSLSDGAELELALPSTHRSAKRVRIHDQQGDQLDDLSQFLNLTDDGDLSFNLPAVSTPPTPRRSSSSSSSSDSLSSSSGSFSSLSPVSGRYLPDSTSAQHRSLYHARSPSPPVAFSASLLPSCSTPSNLFSELDWAPLEDVAKPCYDGLELLDDAFGGLKGWWETTEAEVPQTHMVASSSTTGQSQATLISEAKLAWTQPPSVPSHVNTTAARPVAPLPNRTALRPRPTYIKLPLDNLRIQSTISAISHSSVPAVTKDFATALEQNWDQKRQRFDLVMPSWVQYHASQRPL